MPVEFLAIPALSFMTTVIATPAMIKVARKTNCLDYPVGNPLAIHRAPTPLLGGAALILSVLGSLFLMTLLWQGYERLVVGLSVALTLLFVMGLYDDYRPLNPILRLAGQGVGAAAFVLISGQAIQLFANPILNALLTVGTLMFFINAVNLLDGMDGLSTGIALVAAGGFLFIFTREDQGFLLSLIVVGASAGFLLYNFAPARIFLGDNGSTVLGFLLGVLALSLASITEPTARFLAPVLVLIVPIVDLSLAILRRISRGNSLLKGDRDHIYDTFLKSGFSQRQTAMVMYGFGLLGSLAAIHIL